MGISKYLGRLQPVLDLSPVRKLNTANRPLHFQRCRCKI